MKTSGNILIAVWALAASVPAVGKTLQCNKQQTRCLTESTDLTIGDQVGIFNTDGELVATGEINAMRGDRRAVKIRDRHGRINKGYDLALLDSQRSVSSTKVYREPSPMMVGGSLGLSHVSIGVGSPATEFSGFAQWRTWNGLQLIGRAVYQAMEGSVSRFAPSGATETQPISMTGLGLLGGAGYIFRENKFVSFRGEAAAGIMQVSASIDGDASLVNDKDSGYKSNIKNGMAPYGRWMLGAMLNYGEWHVHADLAQSIVHQAFSNTVAAGVSLDMK